MRRTQLNPSMLLSEDPEEYILIQHQTEFVPVSDQLGFEAYFQIRIGMEKQPIIRCLLEFDWIVRKFIRNSFLFLSVVIIMTFML